MFDCIVNIRFVKGRTYNYIWHLFIILSFSRKYIGCWSCWKTNQTFFIIIVCLTHLQIVAIERIYYHATIFSITLIHISFVLTLLDNQLSSLRQAFLMLKTWNIHFKLLVYIYTFYLPKYICASSMTFEFLMLKTMFCLPD